jgi:pyrimidine-specific ribonucleoside hydrolase
LTEFLEKCTDRRNTFLFLILLGGFKSILKIEEVKMMGVNYQKRIVVLSTLLVIGSFNCSASAHTTEGMDSRKPVCLLNYPTSPELFNDVVRPHVDQIVERHGQEEWKATLLTNEMHRHLGMWSIVGAKMGVRAREVLHAPFDHLQVVSFAGNTPPFSCINDGIQVSTGASLGRGTISNTSLASPEAIFIFNSCRLLMRPKPEIKAEIRSVIKKLSNEHGFQTPAYFKALDEAAVHYWLAWDRTAIFDEVILPQ